MGLTEECTKCHEKRKFRSSKKSLQKSLLDRVLYDEQGLPELKREGKDTHKSKNCEKFGCSGALGK